MAVAESLRQALEYFLNDWSRGYGFRGCRSDHNHFGYGHFLLFRSFRDDRDYFDIRVGRECWNWFLYDHSQFDGSLLRINKFLAEIIAGIKPRLQGFRVVARALCELDDGIARWFKAVVVDCQNGGDEMRAIRIEDLNDVAVGWRIEQDERVSSSRQVCPGISTG